MGVLKSIYKASLLALVISSFLLVPKAVHAAYVSSNLIANSVFVNYSTMTQPQIQAFLAGKGSGLTNYSAPSGDHGGASVPASQIIYDASQDYGMNPQVILATLQKEQGLVTDPTSPGNNMGAINCAMGYLSCDSGHLGFFTQVDDGTWQLRYNYEAASGRDWGGHTAAQYLCKNADTASNLYNNGLLPGNTVTFADPYYSPGDPAGPGAGARTITLANAATASLYCYTPYVGPYSDTGYSGSYNFVINFEAWFGTTQGLPYAWSLLGVSYSTGTNSFGANTSGTVTVSVINNGSSPWYNYGGNPVNLATWNSPGHNSPLYSPGWLSPNTLANMNQSEVDPGGTATFTVPINVSQTGTYIDAWNLIVQNSGWMGWQGLSPTIAITPPYTWKVNSVLYGNGTGVMIPGTQQLITVKTTNVGSATWSKSSGPDIELATWGPGRTSAVMPRSLNGWLSGTAVTQMNQSSVAPGQEGDFQFYVQVPSSGYFYERFNLVAQGQQWFNDVGLTLYLKGGTYSWSPISSDYSNATVNRGTTYIVTLKVQNTGDVPWSNSSPWPINIATDNPQNRGSILYSNGWINGTTPAGLQESSVAPGQQGTFVFPITVADSTPPGVWNEHFNLVAQGLTWLNDPGFSLNLTVH